MAEMRVLRTYRYIDKNPVVDVMRTALQDVGVGVTKKQLRTAAELSGLSVGCLVALFHGNTKNPQHRTVAGLMTAIGYRERWEAERKLDIEKERELAFAWREQTSKKRKRSKPNGRR